MNALLQDIRTGLRILCARRGFTAAVVIVLGLGIGANVTIFGAVNALLFSPLPYKDADRLVTISEANERFRGGGPGSYATLLDWKSQNQVFEDVAALGHDAVNLAGGGDPERVNGLRVSQNLLSLLGIRPAMGRGFAPADFGAAGSRVVLVTHNLWQRRFSSDPGVVGQAVRLNGEPYVVIGVLPAELKMGVSLGFEPALWRPLVPPAVEDRSVRSCLALARLKPGITTARAQADMEVLARRIAEAHPATNKGWTAIVSPLRPEVDTAAYALLALLVCSILGLVCTNVTNLLLARGTQREREMALRAALGATRMRLVRQLLTENLLLLVCGCALGILVAAWACDLINSRFIDTNLAILQIRIDARVLAATAGLFVLAGAIVGLIPALQLSGSALSQSLKEGERSVSSRPAKRRFKNALVASEVAFSLMLLMGASLAVKSWFRLWSVDLGFRPQNTLAMRISLPDARYPDGSRQTVFFEELLRRLRARADIVSAAVASDLPTSSPQRAFVIPGSPPAATDTPQARLTTVSEHYFSALMMRLTAGRQFTERDAANSPPVAIVNEAMARRYWNGRNPVGSSVEVAGAVRTIVGIVGDVRSIPLSLRPFPEIYVPFAQVSGGDMALVVRTMQRDPLTITSSIKEEVLALDPDQPVSKIMTLDRACSSNMGAIQLGTSVLTLVAIGSLALAAVGIYGVLSFAVSQRTHEIGVRMALGARPHDVLCMVLEQGMRVTAWGIIPGLLASFALGRVLSNSMFGIAPIEFLVLAGISLMLMTIALMACYLPARRAATVDPMQALKDSSQ